MEMFTKYADTDNQPYAEAASFSVGQFFDICSWCGREEQHPDHGYHRLRRCGNCTRVMGRVALKGEWRKPGWWRLQQMQRQILLAWSRTR